MERNDEERRREDERKCEPGDGGPREDHLSQTAGEWERSFYRALAEVRVELLKDQIKARWGKNLQKTAQKIADLAYEQWELDQERIKEQAAHNVIHDQLKDWIKQAWKKGPQ